YYLINLHLHSFPTRRSSDLQNISVVSTLKSDSKIYWIERSYFTSFLSVHEANNEIIMKPERIRLIENVVYEAQLKTIEGEVYLRSEEHTSELQSRENLVCRL